MTNQTVAPEQLLALTIVANDPDGDQVTLSAAGDPIATLGATFNPASGEFRWTPAATVTGNFRVVFVVGDNNDGLGDTGFFDLLCIHLDQNFILTAGRNLPRKKGCRAPSAGSHFRNF